MGMSAHPRTVPVAADVLGGFDLTDLDNFAHGFPHDVFAVHRRAAPVLWHGPTACTPDGDGFWSVATLAETLEVVHDAATFSSERGGDRAYGGTIIPDQPIAGAVLNMMDDPRHQRIRRLVSHGLTPKTVADLEIELRLRMHAILDDVHDVEGAAGGGAAADVVDIVAIAGELPLQAISMLMGVPEADRHRVGAWLDHAFDFKARDYLEATAEIAAANAEMFAYGTQLVAEKRAHPGDDMLSVVVHASLPDEDPPQLTDEELHLFFSLLYSAGAETTRSAMSGGLLALASRPDQWRALRDDALTEDRALVTTAIEEIVRWTSPAAYNRRTATCDTELGGLPMRAGDKVVFWEASANRDERVFPDSMTFDVRRDPNPHVGFGHGIHHCLGASLARMELRVMLDAMLERYDALELAGEPEWTRSNKHTGLRHVPVLLHRAAIRSNA
jgi:cytochrome P450